MSRILFQFYGPRIGALYRSSNAPINPMFFGGGQESGLRSGTENTPMIIGLGEAALLATENIQQRSALLCWLRQDLFSKLKVCMHMFISESFIQVWSRLRRRTESLTRQVYELEHFQFYSSNLLCLDIKFHIFD